MLNAIILAGYQPIKNSDDKSNKALLPINGKIMVQYVIDAVKGARGIDRVIVAGPKAELEKHLNGKVDGIVDSTGSIMDSVVAAIKYLGMDKHLLICTSDIPMVTSEAINDFVERSIALKADLTYPIVEKRLNDEKYPEVERTYVKLKDGTFTGGNIFYVNPEVVIKGYKLANALLNARKNPVKMARMLSLGILLRLLLGTLTISRVEDRFSRLLGINARAIVSEYPEIGNDIDKPSDVIFAATHLSG